MDIRNENGIWINSSCFTETARTFLKEGKYCGDPKGTIGYKQFWDEEWRRINEGYEVCGAKITADHYFYLNYCPIKRTLVDDAVDQKVIQKKKVARKEVSFPDFWDGDYNYFWIKEIAAFGTTIEELKKLNLDVVIKDIGGGKHLIIGKARRKGFSYKNGAIATRQYTTERDSLSIICAFEKKYLYPKGTMTMATGYSNFINEHTDFGKRRLIDKTDHIKSGFKRNIDGIEVEKGFKSEILALTFKDNPDAIRGKDGNLVLMEEVGDWNNMKSAFAAIQPSVRDGDLTTGQIIMFGTGGDMLGSTVDFNHMFNNPEPYDLLAFDNIWDENVSNTTSGYFFPTYQNLVGFIDKQGNSLKQEAIISEIAKREKIAREAKDRGALTKYITEMPFNPKEAFSISTGNIFDGAAILKQIGFIKSSVDGNIKGSYGLMSVDANGKAFFNINEKLRPCTFGMKTTEDTSGCWVVWEQPEMENAPYGYYLAGTDPYDQDKAPNSVSLGSTFIMKRATPNMSVRDQIVAEYTARPDRADEHHEQVRLGLMYYNGLDLYENEKNTLKMHFEHKGSLHHLAHTPTILKATENSNINRTYGIHMTKSIKSELEIYTRDWLMTPVEGDKLNLHFIYSIPLLEELAAYNEDGNFDRVIAFMLCICNKLQFTQIITKQKEAKKLDDFFNRTTSFFGGSKKNQWL